MLLRRLRFVGLVQDERLTKPTLGVDSQRARRRLSIVLGGETGEFVAGSGDQRLTRGDALYVAEGVPYASRLGECDALEIEWEPGTFGDGGSPASASFRLGEGAHARARDLADRLRDAKDDAAIRPALAELLRALSAEGASFDADTAHALPAAIADDQRLMDAIDRALSDLERVPMLVDLEASLGQARRTLTRAIRRLHERYALLGRGDGQWRAMRDVHRLVVAAIFVSHRDATPGAVARHVGYGSVEALDHAFRAANLPSPAALQRAVIAA